MFEAAEIKHKVDKATFKREEPKLRAGLIKSQYALADKKPFEVVVLICGLAGAGRGEVLGMLNEWLDPRLVETADCDQPSDEDRERRGHAGMHTWGNGRARLSYEFHHPGYRDARPLPRLEPPDDP